MRILGLDLGTRSLGVSMSDKTELIASFYGTINFNEADYETAILKLKPIIENEKIEKIVLGLPKNMNNSEGEAAQRSINFKEKLESAFNLEVILQDERLSTKEAESYLIASSMSRKKRKKKVDSVAATIILQTYLDRKDV